MSVQAPDRFIHGPLERLGDARSLKFDIEHLALEPRTATHLARDEHICEEHHLDEDVAGAFTAFAAAAGYVERERAGLVAARARERLIREQRAQLTTGQRTAGRRADGPPIRFSPDRYWPVSVAASLTLAAGP